jgi:hypothetical protein
VLSPCLVFSQQISFYFPGGGIPTNNSVWTDTTISINVQVYASAQITAVTASAGGRQIDLSGSGASYAGNLSLSGLPGDTLTLVVAARDALNNTGDTAFTFIYRPLNDPAVPLTLNELADSSAVKSSLPLQARSPGNDIAVYYVVSQFADRLLVSAKDSIPAVDLSSYNGQRIQLKVIATDNLGRTNRRLLTAFIDNSPYLTPFLTVNGRMLDFHYNKALVAVRGSSYPVLVDVATGQQSTPLADVPLIGTEAKGYVTPVGAMFGNQSGFYEWKNGQLIPHGVTRSFDVSGNYAVWQAPSFSLARKQLVTGDSETVRTGAVIYADVADNGMAVYSATSNQFDRYVGKYDSGRLGAISNGLPDNYYDYPLTDGYNAIFMAGSSDMSDLYFYNGKTQMAVGLGATGGVFLPTKPYLDYQLNNKYAAFVRDGEVTLRDTLGNMRQVSNFNFCSTCTNRGVIDLLNDKGELMISSPDSGRYFVNTAGQRTRINTIPVRRSVNEDLLSRSFYEDGTWYVLIGRTLFKVDLDTMPSEVPQPVVTGLASSYCIAADSQQLRIANLPSAASGISVEVLLDTTVLTVKADSTFAIHPSALTPGKHTISVRFSRDTIQKQLSLSFNITAAVTPALDVTVNVNPITTDSIPVVITATNVTGGGKQPLYTFAWDRDFVNQLQLEGSGNSVTVSPTEFKLGDNWVYARVRTSDQCYTAQTGIDSIKINKTNITAVVDVDNPDKPVIIYPNPFRDQINVNDLQPTKVYVLSLYDVQGKLLLHQRVVNQTKAVINPPAGMGGIYILRVYDEKTKRLLGAQKLVGY